MRFLAALLFLTPALACGGSDAQCVIDTDCPLFNRCMDEQCVPVGGGDVDSSTDSGPVDSGTVDSSTPDTGTDAGTPEIGRGAVQLVQTPNPVMATHSMRAVFTAVGVSDDCVITDLDPCILTECTRTPPAVGDAGIADGGLPDAGTPSFPSAGMITTTGGLIDVSVTPGADGLYPVTGGVGPVFGGGESLTMTALGEGIPAFSGNVVAPGSISLTAPSLMTTPLSIERSADLTFTWTAGPTDPGLVIALLSGSETDGAGVSRDVALSCAFGGSGTSGTILASHLANLPGGGASGTLTVVSANIERVTASGWMIDLSASLVATADTGNPALTPTIYP